MKLKKIVINKFHKFKHVEIDFDKFTSINGKMVSQDGLKFLSEAIKFVLDCCQLSPQKLLYTTTGLNDNAEDASETFVEATVAYPDETTRKFTKSIAGNDVVFQVDGVYVPQSQYMEELISSEILAPPLNTLCIGSGSVNKVSTMNELKRAAFIELFSGSEQVAKMYNHLSALILSAKIDLDASVKNQLGLAAEKKRMKAKMETTEKRVQLVHEMEAKSKELELFHLYHNEKFLELAYDGTLTREIRLDKLKDSLLENVQMREEKATVEVALVGQKIAAAVQMERTSEEFMAIHRDLNMKNPSTDCPETILQASLISSEAKIDSVYQKIKKLATLGDYFEKHKTVHDEFQELQASFEANNEMDLFNVSNMGCIAYNDEIELLKDSIKNHEEGVLCMATKMSSLEEEIGEVRKKRREKRQTRKVIEDKQNEVDELAHQLNKLQNSDEKTGEKFLSKSRAKIVNELKQKFPEQVIGRVSELYKPTAGVRQKFVRDRLGKFAEAIVVDTRDTAQECVAHLKIKQLSQVDEIFLPLNELVEKQKASKNFLPGKKLPPTVDCVFIENLMETLKEHEKVLLFCSKPSLVVQSLGEATTLMKLPESKKLDVVSIDGSICFRKQGFIEVSGEEEKEPVGNHEATIFETETLMVKLKAELVQMKPQLCLLNREILLLDAQMQRLKETIAPYQTLHSSHAREVETLRAELNQISTKLDLRKTSLHNEMKAKMDLKKTKHFSQFCMVLEIASIDDYQLVRSTTQELIKMQIDTLGRVISIYEDDKALIQAMIEQTTFANFVDGDSFEVFQLQQNLELKQQDFNKTVDDYCSRMQDCFELRRDVKQQEDVCDELTHQISDVYEEIYDNLSNVQMCLKQNYEILVDNFIGHSSLSLNVGNIGNFIVPPDNVPVKFHLVSEQLKTIEVNFEHLKKSLKNNVDVKTQTHSIVKHLEKLRESIERTTGKVSETVSEQRLKRVTAELKNATKVHGDFKKKMDELNDKMEEVKEERKKVFEDSLKALNEGIAEFCKFAFGQQVVANLEAANQVEPYLDEIAYFWRTLENVENRVSEFHPEPVAALALLFAVLKMKKQKFVILDDALRDVVNVASLEKFMQQQNHLQIISLTSQVTDESSNYMIRQKSQALVVTRYN